MKSTKSQAIALKEWGDEAKLCLQCFLWKHEDKFHLDVCRKCLDRLWEEIFVEQTRPLVFPDCVLKKNRPGEWPKEWVGQVWEDVNGKWQLLEEELYNAYVALIEGMPAFLQELNEPDRFTGKVQRALRLLKLKSLIRYTKQDDWTYV